MGRVMGREKPVAVAEPEGGRGDSGDSEVIVVGGNCVAEAALRLQRGGKREGSTIR